MPIIYRQDHLKLSELLLPTFHSLLNDLYLFSMTIQNPSFLFAGDKTLHLHDEAPSLRPDTAAWTFIIAVTMLSYV